MLQSVTYLQHSDFGNFFQVYNIRYRPSNTATLKRIHLLSYTYFSTAQIITTALAMSVEFQTASKSITSILSHATSTPSPTDTPYTYHFGSTESESQGASTGSSNPGLMLGVTAGLIVFFALLCTWCCKRRATPTKSQVVAGYPLPQYFPGSYTYPPAGAYSQPSAPPPVIVHEQGLWPGYPVHYNSTDTRAQPGVPSEGPRQLSVIPDYGGQQSAPAPQSLTPQSSSLYSTPLDHGDASGPRQDSKGLSIGGRFPIAPRSG